MKQMKLIVVWASIQYAAHVDGARIHVTGPGERQVVFGDGTTPFATLSGGEGFINSTVTMNAPDFVTMTGASVNEMMALIRDQQATIASWQADIEALKRFVGMMPPSATPALPPAPPPTVGATRAAGGAAVTSGMWFQPEVYWSGSLVRWDLNIQMHGIPFAVTISGTHGQRLAKPKQAQPLYAKH